MINDSVISGTYYTYNKVYYHTHYSDLYKLMYDVKWLHYNYLINK